MIAPPLDLLHRPVAALVRAYGVPSAVQSRDDGQHVVFTDTSGTLDAIVDDDGNVHALDVALPTGTSYALDVDGAAHRFVFGTTTSIGARDELAADAETEGPNFRVFRRGPESAFVLVFDRATSTLTHVVVGDRATLMRLGYLADPRPIQQRFPFTAPVLRHSDVAEGKGTQATVVRLDLDRGGTVRKVTTVIPSGDSAFDTALTTRLSHDDYTPAKLGGRPIGASVFREVRH